jgi:chemotaxis protein MotB
MPRRRRREPEEEHTSHERWLVTYADMITLLMVLFIVMFAMSSIDQKKFNQLRNGLIQGFDGSATPSVMSGKTSILQDDGNSVTQAIVPSMQTATLTPQQQAAVDKAVSKHDRSQQSARYAEAVAEATRLREVLERVERALRKHGLQNDVRPEINDRGLVLSLVSRHVVFRYDLATLTPRGQLVVDTLAPVLRDIPDPLEIDGHTNQEKVKPRYFRNDWELSAARAATVLEQLNEKDGIPGKRLTLSAFGHERPLLPPSKPGSQRINKRVDIVVLTTLPSQTRALLASAAHGEYRAGGETR